MRTRVTSLLVLLIMATISCGAQKTITVEAQNSDISNNLDLQAVASTFGESKDLEDFERRLNDYDSQISNLDLNNDGEVDYLRVIENMENNVHVVVIQAVLDKDVFQDVATIVVERKENRRTVVQVIGDPYIYGSDYVIEPVYVYTPSIFSFFWGYNYHSWYSPYYYGYYPHHYRYRHPFEVNLYLSHVYSHVNHDHRYYYSNRHRNEYAERVHQTMSRNDYGTRHPERNFSSRNTSVTSKRDFDNARGNNTVYDRRNDSYSRPSNNAGTRTEGSRSSNSGSYQRTYTPSSNTRSSGTYSAPDDVYQNRTTRSQDQVSSGNRTERTTQSYSAPTRNSAPVTRAPETTRNTTNNVFQQRPIGNVETRQQRIVTRESNTRTSTPAVSTPSRQAETKTIERKPAETTSKNSSGTSERGSSSSNSAGRR